MKKINSDVISLDSAFLKDAKGWYKDEKGNKYHFVNSYLHSVNDEPAVIFSDDDKEWYKEGDIHRDNDLPAIEKANGDKYWYQEGEKHRENGPAIDCTEKKEWWINGEQHREDGPAVEYSNGKKRWCIKDKYLLEKQFLEWQVKNNKDKLNKDIPSANNLKKLKV